MTEEDLSLAEKRIYADAGGATTAFVASDVGLVRVSVSDDIVGEFSLERRGVTTTVASDGAGLAIGTPEDVLIADGTEFHETGFGPATAVGYHDGLVAAGDGRIARYDEDESWTTLAEIDTVRSVDGPMVAAESGVYRLDGTHVGLDDAYDVSTAGTPLAATDSGLYYLANGWMNALDGSFTAVSGDGNRAHAATGGDIFARSTENEWRSVELSANGEITAITHSDGVYAVTETGEFLTTVGDGWRHRSIGVTGVSGLAIL